MYLREKCRRPATAYPRTAEVRSGFRFLNPQLGRWVSRDPIHAPRMVGLYSFAKQNPAGEIDPTGELSYRTTVGPNIIRKCRQFEWHIKWILDPTEKTGYIIQGVFRRRRIIRCNNVRMTLPPQPDFYEAWVVAGTILCVLAWYFTRRRHSACMRVQYIYLVVFAAYTIALLTAIALPTMKLFAQERLLQTFWVFQERHISMLLPVRLMP